SLPPDIDDPLLVSGADGVGTKIKVAFLTGRHETIGQDLVAMCVNDLLTTGARPLFFLDYFVCGRLEVDIAERVVSGIADGCKIAGCALLGGETAEHPGMYPPGEYDIAGFAVGVVSRNKVLGPARVVTGDRLIALGSSGLHSNGYSLAQRVLLTELGLRLDQQVDELGTSLAEALLVPTKIYTRALRALGAAIGQGLHALCHITGGGIPGNLPRVLPRGSVARVRLDHEQPAIFKLIASGGPVADSEMLRTFNLGVGMIATIDHALVDQALAALSHAGERAWVMGEVVKEMHDAPARVELV
ncbi:MAG TPA: phosphoribosylformylglycinamidine cyclo-ligase, partial [Polyangiaceae bacterium]